MRTADRYAVFGNPIAHSQSPRIHHLFAEQFGQALQYRAELVELGDFERTARAFFRGGGKGLNVTVPFKQDACEFADQLSARALRAGAVNTLSCGDNGDVAGDNTDGIGLVRDMVANLGWQLRGRRVLIVGAGGAVRGILEPLLREKPAEVLIVNRTALKAEQLAVEFADLGELAGGPLDAVGTRQFDVIINGTSAGLSGQTPALPGSVVTERSCCYDMFYGAGPTAFCRWAAQHAAWAVADGLGMLVEQAAQSFYIWRNLRPDTSSVIHTLRETLSSP